MSLEQQLELCANVEAEDQTCTDSQRSADDADTFTGMEEANMVNVCAFDIPLTVGLNPFSHINLLLDTADCTGLYSKHLVDAISNQCTYVDMHLMRVVPSYRWTVRCHSLKKEDWKRSWQRKWVT